VRRGLRDHDHDIAHLRGVAVGPADDAKNSGAPLASHIDRADQVDADLTVGIAAADRKDQQGVVGAEPADLEPAGEDRLPALVIGTRGLAAPQVAPPG